MDNLLDRLYNWKFRSAISYVEGMPEDVVRLVGALGRCYGDVGWGLEGDAEVIVRAALRGIGYRDDDPEQGRLADLVRAERALKEVEADHG